MSRALRSLLTTAVGLVATTLTAPAFAQTAGSSTPPATESKPVTAKPAVQAPAYTSVRYTEDWSFLKDPANRSDYMDPIKYIPLGEALGGDTYLSFGGTLRERYEYFNNFNFNAGPQDEDGYFLTRILLHADLHVGPYLRFFVQGRSSLEDGRDGGPRPADRDDIDLQQGFVDVKIPYAERFSTTVRAGRQEMWYNSHARQFDVGDWSNVRRSFDGVKLVNEYKGDDGYRNQLDAFLLRPLQTDPNGFNDGDDTQALWGLYNITALPRLLPKGKTTLDTYVLGLHQASSPTRSTDSDAYTFGVRLASKPKPFDFDVEAAYQIGQRGDQDIRAFMVGAEAGYTFENVTAAPRPFISLDLASGDGNSSDDTFSTYNPGFGSTHGFNEYADIIARRNLISPGVGVDLLFAEKKSWAQRLNLRIQYFMHWRHQDNDSFYTALPNGSFPGSSSVGDNYIGSSIDFYLTWQVDRHLMLAAGYTRFFTGDTVEQAADNNGTPERGLDVEYMYFFVQYTF